MDLQIEQDERFQRREWRAERVGWTVLTVFVLAGLVGLLGAGPLSSATAGERDGPVRVQYDRVAHLEADETVTFRFGPGAVVDGAVTMTLTGTWTGALDVSGIFPEPAEHRLVPGGMVLEFAVDQPGDLSATVTYRAAHAGGLAATVTVGDSTVAFHQLVLP